MDDDTTQAAWHALELEHRRFEDEANEGDESMKFPAKASADFAVVPAGNHVAICNAVIDLGLQPGSRMYPDPKPQVYIRFELPQERVEYVKDGQQIEGPMSVGRTFTASMSEKANLRKFVESWRGAKFTDAQAGDFDFRKLIGQRCLLNVTHTEKEGKVYANISTATPLPKGMQSAEAQHNPSLFYDLSAPDQRAFAQLPQWLQEKIGKRIVVKEHDSVEPESAAAGEPFNDDIPW